MKESSGRQEKVTEEHQGVTRVETARYRGVRNNNGWWKCRGSERQQSQG